MSGTSVLAYTTPTKTPSSASIPARMPAAIVSLRRRRCFFERGGLPLRPLGRAPPRDCADAGRACPVRGPLPPFPPEREAAVRPRPPAGARREPPPVPRPPPPVLRVRAGGGRRTEPARGATGEVSS